jgi:hydroxyethylthiazole kinase-like uncharacterized protein yjeF
MKILSPEQLYDVDKRTIERQDITSWQLMERASLRATDEILKLIDNTRKMYILAGVGNNGGDGLAIAYHLYKKKYDVEVCILKYANNYSPDCAQNLERLRDETDIKVHITTTSDLSFNPNSIVIDAVFGIGLSRKLPDFVEDIITKINQTEGRKIAIDVPSGLYLSSLNSEDSTVFKADYTLTFQCPKLNFFLPNCGNYVGKLNILDIGLDEQSIKEANTDYEYITEGSVRQILVKRKRFSHKGTYGHLLMVGGQKGMMGCMVLAAKSALRSGVGKVSLLIPKCGIDILQTTCPEAMVIPSDESTVELAFSPDTICIGMGLGSTSTALEKLEYVLTTFQKPMLFDADAINLLAAHPELLKLLPKTSILTPHQGELKRLLGGWTDDYDKIEKLKAFSTQYNCIIVSKDAFTFIVNKESVYINSTGNAGMATAGSGDVLSGLISGLLTQGYSSLNASLLGVYIHGLSGDIFSSRYNENSLIASDLIENFKEAFSLLKK